MHGALVITGPTASGKSGLSLEIARNIDAEIISADSAQVYRGLDIGTAKPARDLMTEVPHHLIDIRDPADPYSAANFRDDCLRLIADIHAKGKVPIIVGGRMLYLKALKDGLADLPEADLATRKAIADEAAFDGWQKLHEELQVIDPASALRIKPTDTQRLQRAIEVFRLTGSSMTELHRQSTGPCPFPLLEIAILPPDRSVLHQAIADRFGAMLDAGFIEEVMALKANPLLHGDLPSIKAVGYRQVWSYLDGEIDKVTMTEAAIAATRQLAKRQFTWLRSWKDLICLEQPDIDKTLKILASSTILA